MSLELDAMRLAELDRSVVCALMENDTEALVSAVAEYIELRKNLRVRVIDRPALSIKEQEAASVLRKISGGKGLPSDKLIERLGAYSGEKLRVADLEEFDLEELGSELFYSWYGHQEYIAALAELRPLILRCEVPQSVQRLVRQVKNCYAFQQYDAAYGLCRTLLEASIYDICERRHLFPEHGANVVRFEKYSWRQLRETVSSGSLNEELRILYGRLCEVLHGRRTVTAEEVREALEQTFQIIERLYEGHGL